MRRVILSKSLLPGILVTLLSPALAYAVDVDTERFRTQVGLWLNQAGENDLQTLDTGLRYVVLRDSPKVLFALPGIPELARDCVGNKNGQVCEKYQGLLTKLRQLDPKPFLEARATEIE